MSTNQRCCVNNCLPVTVDCNDCLIDTNCYIRYDPLICNLRKVFKKYEEKAQNTKAEYDGCEDDKCGPKITYKCKTLAKLWQDYDLVSAAYSYYGGCPKESYLSFFNVEKIREQFSAQYVVNMPGTDGEENLRIICEDKCPFRLCQPINIPVGSKFRVIFIFKYRYNPCDEILNDPCTHVKYDVYVADLPSVHCDSKNQCKVPLLQLHLAATIDTKNLPNEDLSTPVCILCNACPPAPCPSSTKGCRLLPTDEDTLQQIIILNYTTQYGL